MNYKNMVIDGVYPLLFWGFIYFTLVLAGFWTVDMYKNWYAAMLVFTPLNIIGGRVLNKWRTITGYNYKGYQ